MIFNIIWKVFKITNHALFFHNINCLSTVLSLNYFLPESYLKNLYFFQQIKYNLFHKIEPCACTGY